MNADAGYGEPLGVAVRIEDGEELPFILDTGMLSTIVDKSLEPKLGHRLSVDDFTLPRGKLKGDIYVSPKLYLGHTRFMTSATNVMAIALEQAGAHRVVGILGMDVLGHYCIQLDFAHRKVHFLAPQDVSKPDMGKAYPLVYSNQGLSGPKGFDPLIHTSLLGRKNALMLVDTGCNIDGLVQAPMFRWARQQSGAKLVTPNTVHVSSFVWDGGTYTNLIFDLWPVATKSAVVPNLLGLGFLARHLVTLDFPDQVMYLKQTSVGPLMDDHREGR